MRVSTATCTADDCSRWAVFQKVWRCAAGDRVWDTEAAREAAPALLRRLFGAAAAAGMVPTLALGLRLVRCETDNMVAASNCAVQAAYEDGADYWYR